MWYLFFLLKKVFAYLLGHIQVPQCATFQSVQILDKSTIYNYTIYIIQYVFIIQYILYV